MKLYTIKKNSEILVLSENDHTISNLIPITFTEDSVYYDGTCPMQGCGCEFVMFNMPLTPQDVDRFYQVDKSDIVVSEV